MATALLVLACWTTVCHADPILWVDDANGIIGKVDAPTGAVTIVGNSGVILTDIAFDPTGNLYGISFTDLYRINTATGAATLIAPHGVPGGNALVFRKDGTLFSSGFASTDLFTINPATGATADVGNVGIASAGDLAFANGHLYLTAINNDLIRIDLTGANVSGFTDVGPVGFSNVFGLASPDNIHLYGVAGTKVLSIDPNTGQGTVVSDYSGQGLANANGSAFFAEAGAVAPEPSRLVMFVLGTASLAIFRRCRRRPA
jgi:hypothetical protein